MDLTRAWEAIRRYEVDLVTGAFDVELADGERLRATAPNLKLARALAARSLMVDLQSRELEIVLPDGQTAVFELGVDGADHHDAQKRPVVYLDQLHWITLAQQLRSQPKSEPTTAQPRPSWSVTHTNAGSRSRSPPRISRKLQLLAITAGTWPRPC